MRSYHCLTLAELGEAVRVFFSKFFFSSLSISLASAFSYQNLTSQISVLFEAVVEVQRCEPKTAACFIF